MLDVIVTLDVSSSGQILAVLGDLRAAGMAIVNVDELNGVVEGSIDASRFAALRKIQRVQYLRRRFEYIARRS